MFTAIPKDEKKGENVSKNKKQFILKKLLKINATTMTLLITEIPIQLLADHASTTFLLTHIAQHSAKSLQ